LRAAGEGELVLDLTKQGAVLPKGGLARQQGFFDKSFETKAKAVK
jgi:hypothetical protein